MIKYVLILIILNTIIRNHCQSNIMYDRYYCNKNKDFHSLHNEPHLNDFVDIIYRENEDRINVEIQIWKLLKKRKIHTTQKYIYTRICIW